MDMLRIAMLGVAGVFLALLLKSHKPEYSIFLSREFFLCRHNKPQPAV